MIKTKSIFVVSILGMSLSGCLSLSSDYSSERKTFQQEIKKIDEEKNKVKRDYAIIDKPFANKVPYSSSQKNIDWLKSKKVSIRMSDESGLIPVKEILKQLTAEGINISTTLPMDNYFYQGYPIAKGTDAYTALQILTEAVGLDFNIVDNGISRFVQIQEMGTSEFTLFVHDVKIALEVVSGKKEDSGQDGDSSQGDSSLSANAKVDNKVVYVNEFWDSLKAELESKLTIMVPEQPQNRLGNELMPMSLGGDDYGLSRTRRASEFSGYKEVKVGKVSTNPVTGNISITAPKNIRERMLRYLKSVDDYINTGIQISAKVISVNRNSRETAGIDATALINLGNSYNVVLGNDTLGNLTISDALSGVSATNALTNSMLGITKNNGKFAAFIDYMSTVGNTEAVTEVSGVTRSGRPLLLTMVGKEPRINSSSQSGMTDGGATTGGTTNTITEDETGITGSITPEYDPKSGVVRSLVNLKLILAAGETVQAEPLVAGDGIEIIQRRFKNTTTIELQSETISKNGQLLVAGGMSTQKLAESEGGIRFLKDTFIGGLFGNASKEIQYTDYYIVIETNVMQFGRM
ncbi:hypothetical protein KW507_15870 [Vibrio fluvialis]|nr:hypothetical protein [Vibrio fluvialis]